MVLLVLWCLVCISCLVGCKTPFYYKTAADGEVYNIIDNKWQDNFGSKANYRLNDFNSLSDANEVKKFIPQSGVLSLPQAVAVATKYNRQYQLEKELLYISALDLMLVRHQFEPQFFGFARGGYSKVTGEDITTLETGFESERLVQELVERRVDPEDLLNRPTGTGIGFNQLLATGALFSAEVASGWWHITGGDLPGSSLASVLRMNVVLPLLRGSDRAIVMESLTQAERDTLYQLRTFNRFRQTFVVAIINQYHTALLQHDLIKNARLNCEVLAKFYDKTEQLVKAGRVPIEELDRISQEKLKAQDVLIQAEKTYKQLLDEFKLALALPTNVEFQLDDSQLDDLRKTGLSLPEFSEEEAIKTALGLRLDLANKGDAIADSYRKIAVAADAFRTGLNINTKIGVPVQAVPSSTKIFSDNIETFLELDLPLDRKLEQNLYSKALITFDLRRREYEEARDLIMLQVRQDYRDLIEAAERYRVQLEGIALAQKRFDDTLVLLQYGRASTRRVLDAQDSLLDAQNVASEALINYTNAILNFYCNIGVLEVRPDGMWDTVKIPEKKTQYQDLLLFDRFSELGTGKKQPDKADVNSIKPAQTKSDYDKQLEIQQILKKMIDYLDESKKQETIIRKE